MSVVRHVLLGTSSNRAGFGGEGDGVKGVGYVRRSGHPESGRSSVLPVGIQAHTGSGQRGDPFGAQLPGPECFVLPS